MKKLLKRYRENKTAQMFGRLAMLAYLVTKHTKYHVWVDYSGHVNWVEVRICPNDDYNNILTDERIIFDRKHENAHKQLNKWIGIFEDMLRGVGLYV